MRAPGAAAPSAPAHQPHFPIYGAPAQKLLDKLTFARGSARIRKEDLPTIDAVAEVFHRHRFHIEVRGHLEKQEAGFGASLSKARAETVLHALLKAGAPEDRLTAVGVGFDPLEPGAFVDFRIVRHEGDEE
jgi:flagellar motor protein MotB